MTLELEQIKLAYEVHGISPELIAEDKGLDLMAVKAGLIQCSRKYRSDIGMSADKDGEEKSPLDFTDDEEQMARAVIVRTAQFSEDPKLAFNAACYIRDDKKGRKDAAKNLTGGGSLTMLQINQQILLAREKAAELTKKVLEA